MRAKVRVHEPPRLLEGEVAGGSRVEDDAEPEENTRKVVETASNPTEETPVVEPGPVRVWLRLRLPHEEIESVSKHLSTLSANANRQRGSG